MFPNHLLNMGWYTFCLFFYGGVRGSKHKNYVYWQIHGSQLKAVCHAGNLVLALYNVLKYSKSNTWIRACTELWVCMVVLCKTLFLAWNVLCWPCLSAAATTQTQTAGPFWLHGLVLKCAHLSCFCWLSCCMSVDHVFFFFYCDSFSPLVYLCVSDAVF